MAGMASSHRVQYQSGGPAGVGCQDIFNLRRQCAMWVYRGREMVFTRSRIQGGIILGAGMLSRYRAGGGNTVVVLGA